MDTRLAWVHDFQRRIEAGDAAARREFESMCESTLRRIVRRTMASRSHATAIRLLLDHELRQAAARHENVDDGDPQRVMGHVAARISHLLLDGKLSDADACDAPRDNGHHPSPAECFHADVASHGPCLAGGDATRSRTRLASNDAGS